jgi:predicted acyl esterase
VGIGYVDATYSMLPGQAAVVAARVWDVAPEGSQLLVSRGVYRLDTLWGDPPTGALRVPFYGNQWDLPVGHRLRLDLQQVDALTYNPPKAGALTPVTLTDIRLVLPTRAQGDLTLPAT